MEQRLNSCAQPNAYAITTYFAILAEMSIFLPVQLELRSSSESIQPVMKSFVSELGLTLTI